MQNQRAGLDKQRADVAAMFDGVAPRYDLMNDVMTGGVMRWWRHEALRAIDPRPGIPARRLLHLIFGDENAGRTCAPFPGKRPLVNFGKGDLSERARGPEQRPGPMIYLRRGQVPAGRHLSPLAGN